MARRVARKTLEIKGHKQAQVSILFCEDTYIKNLNREHRKVDAATDVLAFSMQEGRFPNVHPEILGDLVISVETASHQAKRYKHSLDKEIALLIVHGILHLLGYDHVKKKDKEKMRKEEKKILRILARDN